MPVTISGTNGVTFNDSTTQSTAATAPTTAQVLSATAGASVGAVGTYAYLQPATTTTYAAGSTLAGSSLRYANSQSYVTQGGYGGAILYYVSGTPSGTWRLMGYCVGVYSEGSGATISKPSVWLRIS